MRIVGQAAILILWLIVIPISAGGIAAAAVDKKRKNLPFLWITGQIMLWAVFQVMCVPLIWKQDGIQRLVHMEAFELLCVGYQAAGYLLAAAGLASSVYRWRVRRTKAKTSFQVISGYDRPAGKFYGMLWGVFALLLVFQLVQAAGMTYADGDDAYYVAISTIAEESNSMYRKLPYTGGATELDVRHGLAPFPIWIAFLARISGIRTVSVAHIAVPLVLIPMTYGVYYLIGQKVCGRSHREKLPLFLVMTELLTLFGDYSFYTVENFMIARSRQGKAALGSIVIPVLIFLLLILLERLQENQKIEWMWWVLLACGVTAGCLCTTLGALLVCMLIGVTGLCAAVCYRRWKILLPMAVCCIPAVCYAVLYLLSE